MGANSEAGKRRPPGTQPLLDGYLEHLAHERRLSRHTVTNYARDIAALFTLAGGTPLKELKPPHVRRCVAQLHARLLAVSPAEGR